MLEETKLKSGSMGKIMLPFMDTTSKCLSFFYWMTKNRRDSKRMHDGSFDEKKVFLGYLTFIFPFENIILISLFVTFQKIIKESLEINDLPFITVVTINEELAEKLLVSINELSRDWSMVTLFLPSGINRIIIKAIRSISGESAIAIDDISVKKCHELGLFYILKRLIQK